MHDLRGERLFDAGARFEVRRLVGAGGMGMVYEAWDRELDERVALKTLRSADGWWLARFKQEFRSLHDLSHRNLVRLGELFDGPEDPFFSMELVEGSDFLTWVRRAPPRLFGDEASTLSPSSAAAQAASPRAPGHPERDPIPYDPSRLRHALRQLATAVAVLHEAGKVHRDIKPSNIMVTGDGRLVLLDFGLVADIQSSHRRTGANVVGTVEYMAPEQALEGTVTAAADWYSVGVVLFEALTGRLPHTGRTPHELVACKHRPLVATPRALVPDTPEDLDELCVALLSIRPERRPGVREILERLGAPSEERVAEHGDSQFVGRGAELEMLRAAFDSVAEEPVAVVVEGLSGVGKSQLVDRFLEQLVAEEPSSVVLAGRCYEREIVPFKAFDGIADSLARHLASLPSSDVEALLPRRPALLSRLFPVFKRVEAIAAAPTVADLPDPQAQRLRMFGALRELFLRMSLRRRLVWFVDDLQWTDADSIVLLSELLTHEERLPVLLVATVRPVDDPARRALLAQLARLAPARRIRLGELAPDDALELATRLLPQHAAEIREAVASSAAGHPMLLHELARHIDESLSASGERVSLDEMLRRRIGGLPRRTRELLEVVALFGGPITQEVAAAAAEMPSAEQVRATRDLRAAHLVRTDGVRRTDRIVTYHDRVREHVDAHLDDDRRRHLHERLAIALERTGAAEREPRALVRHARAAGRPALAARYALVSARQSVASLAFDQAAEFFAEAIELGSFDETALRALRIEHATALMHAGRGPEAATAFMAAAEGAEPAVRFDCQRQAAEQWIITGHLEQGMAALRSSLDDIGEPPAASPNRALLRVLWHRTLLRLRGMRHATLLESQVPVETLRRLDVLRAVAHGLAMIDNIRGADFNGRYLLLALRTGESRRLLGALASEIVFLASQGGGAGRQARRLFDDLRALSEACPDKAYAQTWLLLADGAAAFFEGRFRAAADALQQTEEIFAQGPLGLTYEQNNSRVFRVHALRVLGEVQRHGALIAEQVRLGRQRGDRYLETTLRLLQVQSLLARDDLQTARRSVDEATWTPPSDGYHLQHWYELRARVELALYEGNAPIALPRLAPQFAALRRSLLLRVKLVRADAHYLHACLLLSAAPDGTFGQVRPEVQRLCRELEGEEVGYARVFARIVGAELSLRAGKRAEAIAALREAIDLSRTHHMSFQLAAASERLGVLLGGAEGSALRAEAARWASEQGVVVPARFFELAVPGASRGR